VLTVEKPSKLIYIAGQTPADDNYQPLHPGDLRAQYAAVLDGLTLQLKAAGATWDDVVFRRMYALDVPAFLKVLNDCTLPVPWDVNPAVAEHADRRHRPRQSRLSHRGRDHGGGGGVMARRRATKCALPARQR
jgi:enamine deaminase RidA (YjgF/YER057c/UK114 family)